MSNTDIATEVTVAPPKPEHVTRVDGFCHIGREAINPLERFYVDFGIIHTTDTDGQEIFLPAFAETTYGGSTTPLPVRSPPFSLSDEQKQRLKTANKCNLDPFSSTHMALNTDLPIKDFLNFQQTETPGVISLYGPPNVLKSKTLAIINYTTKVPVFSFDSFSPRNIKQMQDILMTQNPGLSLPKLIDLLKDIPKSDPSPKKTLRETTTQFINFAQQNRSPLYLIDLPGLDLESRSPDVFDMAAQWSLNSFVLFRNPTGSEEDAIHAYLDEITSVMWLGSVDSARARNQTFRNQIDKLK